MPTATGAASRPYLGGESKGRIREKGCLAPHGSGSRLAWWDRTSDTILHLDLAQAREARLRVPGNSSYPRSSTRPWTQKSPLWDRRRCSSSTRTTRRSSATTPARKLIPPRTNSPRCVRWSRLGQLPMLISRCSGPTACGFSASRRSRPTP